MAEAAVQMEEYAVSDACIACDACCNDFPDIFVMNADHTKAIAKNAAPKGKFDPWEIIYDCPVDAISLIKGELPPPPENKKKKSGEEAPLEVVPSEDTRPWEIRWEEAKRVRGEEPYWERMKRYGMATTMEETGKQYLLRLAMPERVPDHPLKFKWNLPDKMPDYKFDIRLARDGGALMLKGWMDDQRVRRLCGVANSFPDRFLREVLLPAKAKELKFNYNPQDKVLDVVIDKAV
jgi:ferredoxin